jgi:hypothetical protein
MAQKISNKPWEAKPGDYKNAAHYADSSLINLNDGPEDEWTLNNIKLPVKEPGGALNKNAVFAAAAVLGGARGGIKAPPEAKKKAAKKLLVHYQTLQADPPDSLKRMAQL